MIKTKNIISYFISFIIIFIIVYKFDYVKETIKNIELIEKEIIIPESNKWKKNNKFMHFKETNNFKPNNYDELTKVFYTILNNGWKEFTFYCGDEYVNCVTDIDTLSNDVEYLSKMADYIHPFNKYKSIYTGVNEFFDGTVEIIVKIEKYYTDDEIAILEHDINLFIVENINNNMSAKEKIKKMHDAIINRTKYDKKRAETGTSDYDSSRIQGVLYDKYAVCSGYTDTMAVILDKLNIPNFMVASDEHVWNAVYLDNKWYHLDLTWDDPITTNGKNVLYHDFFLINTKELNKLDKKAEKRQHIFNKDIYLEFK